MERKTASKKDLLLIVFILLIAAVMSLFFFLTQNGDGVQAVLSINGRNVAIYDLASMEDQLIDLQDQYGVPVLLEIKNHAICFKESQCPDHICENYGYISRETETAVCMPNRTVLSIHSMQDNIHIEAETTAKL